VPVGDREALQPSPSRLERELYVGFGRGADLVVGDDRRVLEDVLLLEAALGDGSQRKA
jgi:hypothetical protein